ncbi:MAG: gas vesicle protein [Streptosporangiaceae bacterium]|nr:gas vesicle protein [Streptosporangiaceae bacterium]
MTGTELARHEADPAGPVGDTERVALVDLLDRVLAGGVVLTGDVTLAIADVELVTVSLRALVMSASALAAPPRPDSRDAGARR